MAAPFRFSSLDIEWYRGLEHLSLSDIANVHILGGSNGVGKSTVLDAAFHLADRLNPITLLTPFSWRNLPLAASDNLNAIKQTFHLGNVERPIKISASTTAGHFSVSYRFGPQRLEHPVSSSIAQPNAGSAQGASSLTLTGFAEGYSVTGTHGSASDVSMKVQANSNGLLVSANNNLARPIPICMMLNSFTRRSGPDQAQQFSNVIKEGKKTVLDEFLHLVHPKINDIGLLTSGGIPFVHALVGTDNWVPLSFLGQGASDLFSIAIGFVIAKGGVVFLDEFDAVVHHSLHRDLWQLIYKMSKSLNVQVMCTTHSEESLEAAVQAAERESFLSNIRYTRLRKDKNNLMHVVEYDGHLLRSSMDESWEVR